MKRVLFVAALLCMLAVGSTAAFANAYVNFAGVSGYSPLTTPFSLTSCFGPANCTPSPVLAPWSVTFATISGVGGCTTGVCQGTAMGATESFSVPVDAFALYVAPNGAPTTVSYWYQGHQVGTPQTQWGGMLNQQQSAHLVFDTVQFSWTAPTNFKFYQGSFDAVPEPSSLLLLGSGLVGLLGIARRKLF